MNNLPDDIKRIIWEFYETYHIKYKKCKDEIEYCKELHQFHKNRFYFTRYEIDEFPYSKFIFKYYLKSKRYYRF